ncbi:uncharacterized protein LOC131859793 [Cryptomeria japonica]|uniref:uncharacterized protein LOC131859793 n=1 Tax=Cryptomeria japonica TaxID=3369 RepID=UPI0027D9FF2E|nr:uncharacterized protein LOC131859793 [Cryptomeria japonica]
MESATLWNWYLDWLYQYKELKLYIDVSQMGFTDEFMEVLEPKFQNIFKALEEIEAGSIANPDECHMVKHYWLSMSSIVPNSSQCEFTLNLVLEELQKDLWAVQMDARVACCTDTTLSVAAGLTAKLGVETHESVKLDFESALNSLMRRVDQQRNEKNELKHKCEQLTSVLLKVTQSSQEIQPIVSLIDAKALKKVEQVGIKGRVLDEWIT